MTQRKDDEDIIETMTNGAAEAETEAKSKLALFGDSRDDLLKDSLLKTPDTPATAASQNTATAAGTAGSDATAASQQTADPSLPAKTADVGQTLSQPLPHSEALDKTIEQEALEIGYEIRSTLGAGGMGAVYLARDTSLNRLVALKTVLKKFTGKSGAYKKFREEAEFMANFSHPNIVAIHAYHQTENYHFFIMDYQKEGSLMDRLRNSGPLPESQALLLLIQICHGLEAAHKKGIVHLDLKPANILLEGNTPKLTDFGIAHALEQGGVNLGRRGPMGTPVYMAPEQASAGVVGPQTDVYGICASFYFALTLNYPLACSPDSERSEIFACAKEGRLVPIEERKRKLSSAMVKLINKGLEPDQVKRFPDMAALRQAAEAALFKIGQEESFSKKVNRYINASIPMACLAALALFTGHAVYNPTITEKDGTLRNILRNQAGLFEVHSATNRNFDRQQFDSQLTAGAFDAAMSEAKAYIQQISESEESQQANQQYLLENFVLRQFLPTARSLITNQERNQLYGEAVLDLEDNMDRNIGEAVATINYIIATEQALGEIERIEQHLKFLPRQLKDKKDTLFELAETRDWEAVEQIRQEVIDLESAGEFI